jgi:hypothetical protein
MCWNTMMHSIGITLVLLLRAGLALAARYYIDSRQGADSNTGPTTVRNILPIGALG